MLRLKDYIARLKASELCSLKAGLKEQLHVSPKEMLLSILAALLVEAMKLLWLLILK